MSAAQTHQQVAQADEAVAASEQRLAEIDIDAPVTAAELQQQRQRAALRADSANAARERLEEQLVAQLEARNELLGAIRRRRSIEELEGRRLATQASLAAHAAQRALDEMASMRRHNRQLREDS